MSESTTAPAVTWRVRLVRRVAGSLGAAVVLAAVGPALANAAGADVPNPVAVALRASGRGIQSAFGTSSTDTVAACESESPDVVETTAVPTETVAPTESVVPSETVVPTESVVPSETVVPTESAAPSVTPEVCESESPSATPEVTESESEEAEETEGPEDGAHGKLVSTVATCAPKGKDPLLAVEGAPGNHGGYVRAAAHGETLTTPWGAFDLSTQAGADELCAAVAAARDALPAETASPGRGKSGKEHGKPTKDKAAKEHAKGAEGAAGSGD